MASLIEKLKNLLGLNAPTGGPGRVVTLDGPAVEQLMHILSQTREDELSCEEVANRLDEYVDCLAGHLSDEEMVPLMAHHLDMCHDCYEAFEALKRAIESAEPNE